MSYIDGYFDRGSDLIRIVERQNGERVSKNIQSNTHFIMKTHVENIKARRVNP